MFTRTEWRLPLSSTWSRSNHREIGVIKIEYVLSTTNLPVHGRNHNIIYSCRLSTGNRKLRDLIT